MSDLLTVPEAAAVIRAHPDTVKRMLGRGELPGVKVAGKWLIRRDALTALLTPHTQREPVLRPREPTGEASRRARDVLAAARKGGSNA